MNTTGKSVTAYLEKVSKLSTPQAKKVLSKIYLNTALGKEIKQLVDSYLDDIQKIEIDESITTVAHLQEVFMYEGIENRFDLCTKSNSDGSKTLIIKGFIPPANELISGYTSFIPATFRPPGYPGTQDWFARVDGANQNLNVMEKWQQISTHVCCENDWIKVREDKVLLPSGITLDSYFVIEYPGAVAILVIINNNVLMVRQYRYPFQEFTWEIPCGAINKSESIKETALRELLEETGLSSEIDSFSLLTSFTPSPGSSNEVIYIVTCNNLLEKEGKIEKDVVVDYQWMPVNVVLNRIKSGEIKHSPTIVAMFHLMMKNPDLHY
jgi:ADP-ribose pyrophosphatase